MVEQMLLESNNVIAENLARHVAIATGHPASFAGAAAAETAVLSRLGVKTGLTLVDGSGLSPEDKIAPAALVQLLALAASPQHPGLRAAVTGLPVAGFAGTLSPGQSVFGDIGGSARGVVRAKTGNLSTVAALAGLVADHDGRVLVFAFDAAQRARRRPADRRGLPERRGGRPRLLRLSLNGTTNHQTAPASGR